MAKRKGWEIDPWGEDRENKKREAVRKAAEGIVSADNSLYNGFPNLNTQALITLTRTPPVFKEGLEGKAFQKALDWGLFSLNQSGNYSLEAKMSPGFSLNPQLEGQVLYFTIEKDCNRFASMFKRDIVRTVTFENGVYPLQPPITIQQWKEIIAKVGQEEGASIVSKLIGMGILHREKGLILYRNINTDQAKTQKNINPREGNTRSASFTYFVNPEDLNHYKKAYETFVRSHELFTGQYPHRNPPKVTKKA